MDPPQAIPFVLNTTTKTWGLNLRENLFSWSNWMSVKQADKEVAQAEATYLAAQQNLILRVARPISTLSPRWTLDANQASLEAISRQLDQADKRFEVGPLPSPMCRSESRTRHSLCRGHRGQTDLATPATSSARSRPEVRRPEQAWR